MHDAKLQTIWSLCTRRSDGEITSATLSSLPPPC